MPNLKEVADDALEARRRQRETEQRRVQDIEGERQARTAARAERVAGEPPGTRELVKLLDGIDAERVDDRAERLVDLCRLHPEVCTPAAAEVLLEVAAAHPTDLLFAALAHLDRTGMLDRDRLLDAAVRGLSQLPMDNAAALVVELRSGLAPGQLRPTFRSAARLAAPLLDFGPRLAPNLALLRVAAAHDLPALLDELQAMIGSADTEARRIGAGAAARLTEFEPSVTPVLVKPLIDALSLPESLDPYMGSPRGDLQDGLSAAFLADPEGTVATFEQRASGASEEVRSALFHVLAGEFRGGERSRTPSVGAAEQSIDAAFRRLGGDWGDTVAFEAATLIALVANWQPALMSSRVDQLFGALLTATAKPVEASSVLELPPAAPAFLQALEAMNRRSNHTAVVRELRKATAHLVNVAPDAIARNVMSIIEAPEPSSEAGLELRDEAIRLLGDLGKRADMLTLVLPALYTALLHSEQRVRARGVEAWRAIAAAHGSALPPDLGELLPALLEDKYVIVHTAVIRGLCEGLLVSDATLPQIVYLLQAWGQTYAADDSNSRVLDEIVHALWRLSGRLPDGPRDSMREHCMRLAEHLERHDKESFVQWQGRGAESLASYPARLLEVLAIERDRVGRRDDDLLRRLRSMPPERLASMSDGILETARAHLPGDSWQAECFVEVLQRAGRWPEALQLAEEIFAGIPDTTEEAIRRDSAQRLVELSRVENALWRGRGSDADAAMSAALEADQRQQAAIAQQHYPWEET